MFCTKCGNELQSGSKFCKFCGNKLNENEEVCSKCGQSTKDEVVNTQPTTSSSNTETANKGKWNTQAIVGFVCSLVGLIILGIYMGILSIYFSVSAMKHLKVFPEEKGKGLAIAGLVIGIIDVAFTVLGNVLIAAFK